MDEMSKMYEANEKEAAVPTLEQICSDPNAFPIPFHPSWLVRDSTKLNSFLGCQRQHLFEYLLGWRQDYPNNHLVFGEAWHHAMEYLLLNGYSDAALIGANEAFLKCYRKEFPEHTDDQYSPKTPANALLALVDYCARWSTDHDEVEVKFTEVAGSVPISEHRKLYFRMDSVLQHKEKGYYFSREHKTKGNGFNRMWTDQWPLSIQVGTYTHVLYCLYPPEKVRGVEINGAAFLKTKRDFTRVPCWRSPDQMAVWLWTVNDICAQMDFELSRLLDSSPEDEVLTAFPMNPTACTKYFGCAYADYCAAWPNPLKHAHEPPLGFVTSFWDPRDMESTHKMDLTNQDTTRIRTEGE